MIWMQSIQNKLITCVKMVLSKNVEHFSTFCGEKNIFEKCQKVIWNPYLFQNLELIVLVLLYYKNILRFYLNK